MSKSKRIWQLFSYSSINFPFLNIEYYDMKCNVEGGRCLTPPPVSPLNTHTLKLWMVKRKLSQREIESCVKHCNWKIVLSLLFSDLPEVIHIEYMLLCIPLRASAIFTPGVAFFDASICCFCAPLSSYTYCFWTPLSRKNSVWSLAGRCCRVQNRREYSAVKKEKSLEQITNMYSSTERHIISYKLLCNNIEL